jgi:hypothetical protein
MTTSEAIELLKDYIKIDRWSRNNETKSDYDKFCEGHCEAIETLINYIESEE